MVKEWYRISLELDCPDSQSRKDVINELRTIIQFLVQNGKITRVPRKEWHGYLSPDEESGTVM